MNKKTIVLLILTALLSACGGGDDTSKIPSVIQPSDDPTLTDEQNVDVPESEVIFQKASDGYTYNEPQPIQDDWIIEPATDDHPATIDESKLSSSWYIPSNYSEYTKAMNGTITAAGIIGKNNHVIKIYKAKNIEKNNLKKIINEHSDFQFVFIDNVDFVKILLLNSYEIDQENELNKLKSIQDNFNIKFSKSELFPKLLPDFKENLDAKEKFDDYIDVLIGTVK